MTLHGKQSIRAISKRAASVAVLAAFLASLLGAGTAQAAVPSWGLSVTPRGNGYFQPGSSGTTAEGPAFTIVATNVGSVPTSGTYTITDTLPPGVSPVGAQVSGSDQKSNALSCSTAAQVVTCTGTAPLAFHETATVTIPVSVAEKAILDTQKITKVTDEAEVSGGGAPSEERASSSPVLLTNNRPAWQVTMNAYPTAYGDGASSWNTEGFNEIWLNMANVGGAATSGQFTVTLTLSPGMKFKEGSIETNGSYDPNGEVSECKIELATPEIATCPFQDSIRPSNLVTGVFSLDTGTVPDGSTVSAEVAVSGGGAADASDLLEAKIEENDIPFDWANGQNGLGMMMTDGAGLPASQGGSHPGEFSVENGWTVGKLLSPGECFGCGNYVSSEGGAKDVRVNLPKGLIVNPQALVVQCEEAQLEQDECPRESSVGVVDVDIALFGTFPAVGQSPLYALDAPYGDASIFGFDAALVGIFPHIVGGVQHGGDYTIAAKSSDIIALFGASLIGLREQFWGNPSDPIHDYDRGECGYNPEPNGCPVEGEHAGTAPLFSMPTSCSGSMQYEGEASSWSYPDDFKLRQAEVIDSVGNPTGVTGCNALEFQPSIEARPTTNIADSPSGLDFDLKVPQHEDLNTLATSHLKKTEVKLPPGLVINPAGANGVQGCTLAEIGIDPGTGKPNGNDPTCPDASRIGSAQVETPLLDHPMPGSVYLAMPHENPFDSLLALYLVVEDGQSGTLIKLSGEVQADPATGQLTTTFDNQPQLPFNDFKLNLFGGAGATLRTPALCGKYTSTSEITPWSGGLPEAAADSYQIANASNGGTCPEAEGGEPNNPSFDAGTLAPVAGAYTPLVVNLRRPDGSQQFSSLTVTAPPGLLGKLAGIPYCPDSALAAAAAKTGRQEQANASCPAASAVGSVNIGAGAGPAPYYVKGTAYLTGPYKGAPLSLAVVTPAVAGAYDLGTVVVRVALHVNPDTSQITGVSDNLPTILQGIPLDIRSVQLALDRPQFTFNPTSCNTMSFTGQSVSTLGTVAALKNRFQVAECVNLGFKPSLALELKGGTKRRANPSLIATYKAREGDANLARAQVKLPPIALLDQAHIGTVCTRVQFNADQCPADSIYGHAEATSPLVGYAVSGPVFLRANPEHSLPDLVASLNGPASQPIEIDLAGQTDAVKGALRNTFEAVPDVPVSTFRLELFGGSKSLIELSRNLCAKKYQATIQLEAQNGKVADSMPAVKSSCKFKKPRHRRHHKSSNGKGR